MSFDLTKFDKASFQPKTKGVSVADTPLALFFEEADNPEFTVRGLTAHENAIANEAKVRNESISTIVQAVAEATNTATKVKEIKKALGVSDNTPADIAKRIEVMRLGCVDPVLDYPLIAKIAEVAPVTFYTITNTILALTGEGQEYLVKPAPSGSKKK